MKTLLPLIALSFGLFSSAQAMITQQADTQNNCELYSVVNYERNAAGEYVLSRELREGERVVDERTHYGLELKNLTIDFDRRSASFEVLSQVAFGRNRSLVGEDQKVSVSADNEQFDMLVNQVNRKLFVMNSICIDRDQQVIYAE